MTTKTHVTREQAETVLELIKKKFATYISAGYDGPELIENWDWLSSGPTKFAAVWEGGPYDWAILFGGGGFCEDMFATIDPAPDPKGVFTEPVTGWALGIYPR